ncbi:transaldolase family protein [Propionibacterium australiense]|uniref:Aldolase-type TIM barrel n=1 Tax=Propionibacterium australiense TaxID=119981 RepID=A0A383S3N6_9ACTN|nr:transaldolase family protein [Propionibacterium australiense]RLP11474.1 transaldolase [Propionibacterium australiense]RLP12789.1 transaldolase [Propionibacterium australiense]SYZ32172.1 Aldolase-type TIM barrel [Propionibacterium australiense]VEH90754.1 Transaldolase [Propionibacterium australiense]
MTIEYTPGPLLDASRNTPTALWNDSADPNELSQSISFGAVGATCNPAIAYTCINQRKDVWLPRIAELAEEMPEATESEIGWRIVRELSIEAAKLLEPIFDEQNGRNGRLSIQTDPRLARNAKALADQAEEFSKLAKNIIVKIPATSVGIKAIEDATYRGVSVNVTVSFSVPQAVATGEAIERGLKRREAEGKDVSTMGPVVTLMVGRLDDWIKIVAKKNDLFIDPGHLEWAGVAAFKRAYQEFQSRGLRARMLSAAFRNVMHWSELVGGDLVVSPPFKWQQLINNSGYKVVNRIDEPVAPAIMKTLQSIPEFVRAYEPDGMTPEEFDTFGATVRTVRGFLQADADLDALVRDVIMPQP